MTQQHRIQVAESRLVPGKAGLIGGDVWVTQDQRGEVIGTCSGDEYDLAAGVDYMAELMAEIRPLQRTEVAMEYRTADDHELVVRAYDVTPAPEAPAATPASRALRELADALDAMATGDLPPVAVEVLVRPVDPDPRTRRDAVVQLGKALGIKAASGLAQDEQVMTWPLVSMDGWRPACALTVASLRNDL